MWLLGGLLAKFLLSDQFGQAEEVVGGATEDEHPVHSMQSAYLHLAYWTCLFQPSEGLFDEPTAAQADAVPRMPCRSAVEV